MILGNKDKVILSNKNDSNNTFNFTKKISYDNKTKRRIKKSIYINSKYTYSILDQNPILKYAYKVVSFSINVGLNSQIEVDLKRDFFNENEEIIEIKSENNFYLKDNKHSFIFNAYRPGYYIFIVKTTYKTYFIYILVKKEKNKVERGL